jgi:hypothetical protein
VAAHLVPVRNAHIGTFLCSLRLPEPGEKQSSLLFSHRRVSPQTQRLTDARQLE